MAAVSSTRNAVNGGAGEIPACTACTVVTHDRLPAAKVLAETYLRHHPGHGFVVFVTDSASSAAPDESGYLVAGYGWLDVDADEYLRLATFHSAGGLVDAVKPLVLRQLLESAEVVVHLAPETKVFAPFDDITRLAVEHDVVVTPYTLTALPLDGLEPREKPGVFDDGFLAVGQGARTYLDLRAERARRRPPHGAVLESDRNWTELFSGFVRHTVVRDPGLAVAYWNVHERELREGPVTGNGSPVRFFRFAGYDPETPWVVSSECLDRPRAVLSGSTALRLLCDDYRDDLRQAGYRDEATASDPYGFAVLPDGSKLNHLMQQLFYERWLKAEKAKVEPDPFGRAADEIPPHPFSDDGGLGFQDWLTSPASPIEQASGLTRLANAVWTSRPDLQAAFPHPRGSSSSAFRDWCSTYGLSEDLIPVWARPVDPPAVSAPVDEFGVNVAGYLTAELGLGEMGRILHRIVAESGTPVVSVVEEHSLSAACRTALDEPETAGRPRFPVSVLAVNSDYTELLLDSHPEVGHERYRIGLWAWELEDFPKSMHGGFAFVDEVWTISEFCRKAIAAHSPVPVKTIPLPVIDPGTAKRTARQAGDPVRFLFAFDFNSTGGRKNPWGAVVAFQRAFPGRDDVCLVIKATNGHLHAATAERLRYAIGDDKRIELLERYLSVEELDALYAGSDAYVSLHRSEGFGLTVAEAMVRGMPVIATDYSSTTEFFGAGVGWPIPYRMVEVGSGWGPYQKDARWADPDLDAAAEAMREVADDPAEARRRGEAAREHVLRTRPMDVATTWVRAQLREAHQTWQDRNTPVRPPSAPALRRVVRRAINLCRRLLGR
jgi:glycosyltransferase involved in cell wall biosynthesis